MLLTNLDIKPTRKSLFFVVEAYPASAGRNTVALTVAVAYFVAVWLGEGVRLPLLTHHALPASKRLFSVPDFRYYALADGIKWAFEGCQTPFWSHPQRPRAAPQIMLPM